MRNIQNNIGAWEIYCWKQDLVYLFSWFKTFAGQPQSLATLILEADPSDEIKELAELIYQSSNQQFFVHWKFLKLLKEQDEYKNESRFKINHFDYYRNCWKSSTVLLIIKKIKLNVSIEIPKDELLIEDELLIRVLVNFDW
jgi:hypothetical protein